MKDISYNSFKMFFEALSNETRFGIIEALKDGPKNVNEICKKTGFEQSRVSHNLKKLSCCKFVNWKWKGKTKVYSIDKGDIAPILRNLDKHISRYESRLKSCSCNLK